MFHSCMLSFLAKFLFKFTVTAWYKAADLRMTDSDREQHGDVEGGEGGTRGAHKKIQLFNS